MTCTLPRGDKKVNTRIIEVTFKIPGSNITRTIPVVTEVIVTSNPTTDRPVMITSNERVILSTSYAHVDTQYIVRDKDAAFGGSMKLSPWVAYISNDEGYTKINDIANTDAIPWLAGLDTTNPTITKDDPSNPYSGANYSFSFSYTFRELGWYGWCLSPSNENWYATSCAYDSADGRGVNPPHIRATSDVCECYSYEVITQSTCNKRCIVNEPESSGICDENAKCITSNAFYFDYYGGVVGIITFSMFMIMVSV